ncbi:chalcone-flavanone isomerase family protein [Actinidia rufa]|uniref:Chalcone-flavanone isomerase family protein n=1 Tax=Actinidia rufa TaxID=165716 RepID=A0A7J0F5I7_9ERIC|nr:chalcone-flavanone isomerase family protein [Actinidia rufa]
METPSTRRVTRSQTLAAANSNNIPMRKTDDSEKGFSKSRQRIKNQQDRSVLFDITNDSPIIGLAMGSLKTPLSLSSTVSKKNRNIQTEAPGSGEALLRGQVKTLLQKVEEEAELSKLSRNPHVSLSGNESFKDGCLATVTASPVQEQVKISQMVAEIFEGKKQESPESEKCLITRSLLLDFSEKSEGADSSGCESKECYSSMEDDNASLWSIQANASTRDDEEEEEDGIEEVVEEYGDFEEAEEYEEDDGGLVDALCDGMSKISVYGEKKIPEFSGRHTRFVYNSEDELEGEEEYYGVESEALVVSPGVLVLKGLPTRIGKHLRFPKELEEEEDD